MSDATCTRCGDRWPTNDNITETTFWGAIETETTTTVSRTVRVLCMYFRINSKLGAPVLRADERQKLCSKCWDQLVGRFMQGRSVPAMAGKETW